MVPSARKQRQAALAAGHAQARQQALTEIDMDDTDVVAGLKDKLRDLDGDDRHSLTERLEKDKAILDSPKGKGTCAYACMCVVQCFCAIFCALAFKRREWCGCSVCTCIMCVCLYIYIYIYIYTCNVFIMCVYIYIYNVFMYVCMYLA
jgi:hypothetical protein